MTKKTTPTATSTTTTTTAPPAPLPAPLPTRRLGRTGLEVSALALGTMQFGWTADEATSFEVLDRYVEAGGNLIDTADVYSRWAEGNDGGVSEAIIGRWMAARGARNRIVLATKARGRMWPGPNGEGLSRLHIVRACEESLARLGTDHIDLYQTHSWDPHTPIDETLSALDDLVRAGKVRYVGCSNIPAWHLVEALWRSDASHLARYDSVQPNYSLIHRKEFEADAAAVCERFGIGVIPYSPLAAGFLTGKYRADAPPPTGARAPRLRDRYVNERGLAVIAALDAVAAAHDGATPAQVALAWLLAQPTVTAPIVGANTAEQLAELLPAAHLVLGAEEMAGLGEASEGW